MSRFYDTPDLPSTQRQGGGEIALDRLIPAALEPRLDLDEVVVLHDVDLALDALGRPAGRLAVVLPLAVFRVGDDLGVDEALLEVRVDAARGLERRAALPQVPGR